MSIEVVGGVVKRALSLRGLAGLKRLGAETLLRLKAGDIEVGRARALFYGLNVMANIITSRETERRISELEDLAEEQTEARPC